MGRKNSSESEDDSKDRRDKHRHSRKRDAEANGDRRHSRHGDESELSDSDKKNRSRRHERRDEKDVRGRDRRQEKEHRERKERVRSSDEDDRRVERERGRRDKVKTHQRERLDSQDEDDREGHKRSEQRRERTGDDEHRGYRNDHDRRYLKDRRGKEEGEHREDRVFQEKEKEEGEVREDNSKSQKQSTLQGSSLNADVSNWGRSGGVYIPPFKLARMMKEVQDKSSIEYQRLTWDALRKSINGLVNKVNATNIKNIIPELFGENLIRGRGLFCRSCMKSQMASPGFTDVFAALVAVVNTKFPEVGELLMRRIVLQFKRAYKRNDKHQLLAAVKFIAHLVNQQVAHEIIALELLALMLENPTDDSVEVAVGFVKECGSILQDLSPKGLHGIFERFRGILHEGEIDKRVQFLIEGLFAIRKAKFQGHPAVRPELDLVEQEDQLTHEISLEEKIDPEITLDIFKPDPQFLESEKRYEELKKTILGEESEDEAGSDAGSDDEDEDEDDDDDDADSGIEMEHEVKGLRSHGSGSIRLSEGQGQVEIGNQETAVSDQKSKEETPGFTVYVNRRPTSMAEVIKDLEEQFMIVCNSANEVSALLEATRAQYASTSNELSGMKMLNPVALIRSASSRSSSSRFLMNSSSSRDEGYESSSDVSDESCVFSGSHQSTLDRLYAWEKKLYDEVKSGEKIRIAYERKCNRLRNQDVRGDDPSSVDKTRAGIRDLHTQIKVSIHSVEAVSKRIEALRDEELQPQLLELVQGLARMWKVMAECHQIQKRTLDEAKLLLAGTPSKIAEAKKQGAVSTTTTEPHRLARSAANLEAELRNWKACFELWITSQRSYMRALAGWLLRCIRSGPGSPRRTSGAPPIFGICTQWSRFLDDIHEVPVLEGLDFFAAGVGSLYAQQLREDSRRAPGGSKRFGGGSGGSLEVVEVGGVVEEEVMTAEKMSEVAIWLSNGITPSGREIQVRLECNFLAFC